MWSHYANSHTGFCIGFDKFILYELVHGTISPVNYSDQVPRLKLFEEISQFHIKQLSTKSLVWEYEEEYRIVKSGQAENTIKYPKEMIRQIYLGVSMSHKQRLAIVDFARQNKLECEIYELTLDKKIFNFNVLQIF